MFDDPLFYFRVGPILERKLDASDRVGPILERKLDPSDRVGPIL